MSSHDAASALLACAAGLLRAAARAAWNVSAARGSRGLRSTAAGRATRGGSAPGARRRWMFYLRAELMRGSPTPERAAELAAEIEELREQQAQTWVAA